MTTQSGPPRVLLVGVGAPRDTTAQLFGSLCDALEDNGAAVAYEIRNVRRGTGARVSAAWATWRELRDIDVVAIHTPLVPSLVLALLARLRRKRLIAYVWDVHPASNRRMGEAIGAKRFLLLSLIERLVLLLASVVVIPSTDYCESIGRAAAKAVVVPIWATSDVAKVDSTWVGGETVRIGFAGQLNGVRGLAPAIRHVQSLFNGGEVQVHIFSPDVLDAELNSAVADGAVAVIERGLMTPDELTRELSGLDFGLVSLDSYFDLPAYPSKTMTYAAAGLPSLFVGPALPGFRNWLAESGLGLCIDASNAGLEEVHGFARGFGDARDRYFAEHPGPGGLDLFDVD